VIIWFDDEDRRRHDPQGMPDILSPFRLGDGTCGYVHAGGITRLGADDRLHEVALPAGIGHERELVGMAGASIDDLFVADTEVLYHVRDGEIAASVEVVIECCGWSLAQDGDGGVYLIVGAEILHWRAGELETAFSFTNGYERPALRRLRSGAIAAWQRDEVRLLRDGRWVPLDFRNCTYVAETDEGYVMLFDKGYSDNHPDSFALWRAGGEVSPRYLCDLVPGYFLSIHSLDAGPAGIYAATDYPTRVFRLESEAMDGRWESVTGPFDGEWNGYVVREDGSLLVFERGNGHIYLRRSRPTP